jgi:hypothetical protein
MTLRAEFDEMTQQEREVFSVVHPLDDQLEEKVNTEHLGSMRMTRTVRICLLALRAYLLLMFGLLGFRVLQLAGVIHS